MLQCFITLAIESVVGCEMHTLHHKATCQTMFTLHSGSIFDLNTVHGMVAALTMEALPPGAKLHDALCVVGSAFGPTAVGWLLRRHYRQRFDYWVRLA